MNASTRARVRERAGDRCEYCLLPQRYSELRHHVEHIVSKQHGGLDADENLALACHRCNLNKGPNIAAADPLTGDLMRLFHPRNDEWADHFSFLGVRMQGITPVGRATVQLLSMNDVRRLAIRWELDQTRSG